MAEESQQPFYNTPFKGMVMDNLLSQVGTQSVTYALNATVEGSSENSSIVYQNEESNQLCCQLPEGFKVCGLKNIIEEGVIILFLATEDESKSEIGKVIDCKYKTYVSDPGLKFSIGDPIHEISYKRTNCDTEIYWASQKNPRRYISINNIPYIDDDSTKGLDLNKILINPNFTIPQIEIADIVVGGDNQAGVYQFCCQYSNAIGEGYTSYYSVTNPTPLFDDFKTTLDFNYPIAKSIQLKITNIDTSGYYDYLNVVVIKTINNISTPELIGTYSITNSTLDITYSGQKQSIPVTLTEIFAKNPIYPYADGVYNVQDVLGWYGPKTQERINLQKIASKIELNWVTYRIKGDKTYANPLNVVNYTSYMRDEIYPFEICFILKNGYQTDSFTIPSREITPYDKVIVNGKQRWQVENTALSLGLSQEYLTALNKASYEGVYERGRFAYWESTEKYPDNSILYGNLANTPIRHHKFPDSSLTHIHDNSGFIYPIGIEIDNVQIASLIQNSDLTKEQKDSIVGYRIHRGNRAVNKSIVAKGIIRNVLKYNNNGAVESIDYAFDNGVNNNDPIPVQTLKKAVDYLAKSRQKERVNDTNPALNQALQISLTNYYNGINIVLTSLYNPTYVGIIPDGILYPNNVPLGPTASTLYINNLNTAYNYITNLVNGKTNDPIIDSYPLPDTAANYSNIALQQVANLINNYNTANSISSTFLTPTAKTGSSFQNDFYFPNYLYNDVRVTNGEDTYLKNIGVDSSAKQRFTFHSPDTSFYQPALSNILKIETIEYGQSQGRFFQVENHSRYRIFTDGLYLIGIGAAAAITLASRFIVVGLANGGTVVDGAAAMQTYQVITDILERAVPYINYAYQFNSVGNYDDYKTVPKIQTNITDYRYLSSSMNSVGENINLNNWNRETCVYLKLSSTIPFTHELLPNFRQVLEDTSKNFPVNPTQTVNSPISIYYTSIKNNIDNLWGQLYSYDTVDLGKQFYISDTNKKQVFGGDTFINKFSFKTKIPFFTSNGVGLPDGADIAYNELSNVGQAKFWYTSATKAQAGSGFLSGLTGTLFGTKAHQLYNSQSKTLYRTGQMFLFAYGIPTFYCESTVNVDLRQAFNDLEGNFYPNVGTSIPNNWLQETNVSIVNDNTYYYNKTFSKQNKENPVVHLPQDFDFSKCRVYYPYRTIFSEVAKDIVNPEERNNWLIYKPSSFFDFPQNYGKLTSITGIENKQALVRFENKTLLYNALYTAPTSAGQVYLGKSLFDQNTPPLDFSDTDLGYIGSQHKFILKTEYGIVTADALRGQVFNLQGQQAKDITLQGMSKFFTEFLNFSISKIYPTFPIDNHFNGVGLTGTYDSKYNRLILTKLDYLPKDKTLLFDEKGFYIEHKKTTTTQTTKLQCNPGYQLKGNICEKITYTPATQTGYPTVTAKHYTFNVYGEFGTILHETFPVNLTVPKPVGYITTDLPSNTFWENINNNTTEGRLNNNSFWVGTSTPSAQCFGVPVNPELSPGPLAFTKEIIVNEEKTYYLGMGADNYCWITLNCQPIVNITNPSSPGDWVFKYWHIFPIKLKKGTNYLTVVGNNTCGSQGIFGYEIYDNTKEELQLATSINDLNVIASSKELYDPVETTLEQAKYKCGDCYSAVQDDNGNWVCPSVEQQNPFEITETVTSEEITKEYIPFTNTDYFVNKSFTISYDFDNQAWISFHSYIPNFYIQEANYFYTGLNSKQSSLWSHQTTLSEFQKFYNEQAPYILEIPYQFKLQDEILQSVVDYHTVLKIDNFQEYVESDDSFFNKLILYTNQQCSGLLELTKKPLSNLKAYNEYPKYKLQSKEVLYTKSDNLYKVNTFWDVTINAKKPNFVASPNSLSEFKILNQINMNYNPNSYKKAPLRTKELKIRYILDNDTKTKIQTKLTTIQSSKSYK